MLVHRRRDRYPAYVVKGAITVIGVSGLALQDLLGCVLLAKKMWPKFPVFTTYVLVEFVVGIVMYGAFVLPLSREAYIHLYVVGQAISLFLGLSVVYELFRHLLTPYPGLKKLASITFQAVLVILIILGVTVIYGQHSGERNALLAGFLVVEEATGIIEVGVLVFLFAFASMLGLHWREYPFGIALGTGICVIVKLVTVTLRTHFGVARSDLLSLIGVVTFDIALLIWIKYLLAPERAPKPVKVPERSQLEQWNRAVMELIYQ